MADVTQLKADLDNLKQAVADDQAAITSVQSYTQAQASEIQNMEQQIATLQSQSGSANLDLTDLETSIANLKQQNQALSSVVVPASPPSSAPAS